MSKVNARVINFQLLGAIPFERNIDTAYFNRDLLNSALANLTIGQTLLIPNRTYYVVGGIVANNLKHVTFQLDGTLLFSDDRDTWPTDDNGSVLECMTFNNIENVTFTSSGLGTFDGNGRKWWGAFKYLKFQVYIRKSNNYYMA